MRCTSRSLQRTAHTLSPNFSRSCTHTLSHTHPVTFTLLTALMPCTPELPQPTAQGLLSALHSCLRGCEAFWFLSRKIQGDSLMCPLMFTESLRWRTGRQVPSCHGLDLPTQEDGDEGVNEQPTGCNEHTAEGTVA